MTHAAPLGSPRQRFRSRLADRPLLVDGGLGTLLFSRGVPQRTCLEELVATHPEMVGAAHREYLQAGAELIETLTFGANRQRLAAWGLEGQVNEFNRRAARLVGLPVERLVLLAFVLSATLAGLAGVLLVARNGSASPQVGTVGDSLQALAAAFLGATTIRPGRFNVPGTLVAIFLLAFTVTGLSLAGVAGWINDVFNGAALFVAVLISTVVGRRRAAAAT
jgi:hypothetical protein